MRDSERTTPNLQVWMIFIREAGVQRWAAGAPPQAPWIERTPSVMCLLNVRNPRLLPRGKD